MVMVKASRIPKPGMPEPGTGGMGKFNDETLLKAGGVMAAGEGCRPVRKAHGVAFDGAKRTVTDGPFA